MFLRAIRGVTGEDAVFCWHCITPLWEDDASSIADGNQVCETCADEHYTTCCQCERLHEEGNWINDEFVCNRCTDRYYEWCDTCAEYVDDDHSHDCSCEAPFPEFTFPGNGDGSIANDCRLTVTLPAGIIDDSGLRELFELLRDTTGSYQAASAVYDLDHRWVTQEGSFTRRLSRRLFKAHGIKLLPGVLSQVGNVARTHSSDASTWHFELTRDLNASASAFYNDTSCWWTDHADSRCTLKSCGGVGLRSYTRESSPTDDPNGRAWLVPLGGTLEPTHSTDAPAYVVFNEYGALEGYAAARLVAHLTSKSYRKIGFRADPMFVNGDTAFLIADEAVCQTTKDIVLDLPLHARGIAA